MYIEEENYTFEYRVFEVGDLVCSSSRRCPLKPGAYVVTRFIKPCVPMETHGTVFVEEHRYGISAEYLQLC